MHMQSGSMFYTTLEQYYVTSGFNQLTSLVLVSLRIAFSALHAKTCFTYFF